MLMDEELVGHLFSSDCTERHSKELAANCKKVQNENVIITWMFPDFLQKLLICAEIIIVDKSIQRSQEYEVPSSAKFVFCNS